MPYGVPKTDEERRKTHKTVYGNKNIPKERKGKNRRLRDYHQTINKK